MKYSHHLSKISFIYILFLLLATALIAQTQTQQLRLANSLTRNHEYEAALKIYKNLEDDARFQNSARVGIIKCLKGMRKYDELVLFLEKKINTNKSGYKHLNSLAEAYLLNSEKDKALDLWNSVLTNHKNDVNVYRVIARSMIKNRLLDNAISVYEQALINLKNQQIIHLDLANLHESLLNVEKATEHYLAYYINFPNQKTFLQRHILKLAKPGKNTDDVENVLDEFVIQHPKKTDVKEILGGLYIKSKKFDRAFEIYRELENSKNNGSYLFRFGGQAQKNHAYDFAIRAFEKLLENEKLPVYSNAYFELAKTYYLKALKEKDSNDSIKKSIEMFQNLASKKNIYSFSDLSCVLLGDIYLDFYFDLDKAISYYQLVYENYPKSKQLSESLIKLGDCYLIKGDLVNAKKSYAKNTNKGSYSITTYKLAELDYFEGNFKNALDKYDLIIKKEGLEDSLANNALERTIFINSYKTDSIGLKAFSYGELLVFQQKYSEAVEHFNKQLDKKNNISPVAGKSMANLLMKLEKYPEANEVFTELIEQYPDDYYADEFLFKSAVIEEILGNYQKSFRLYQSLLDKFQTSLYYEKARENARILSEKIKKEQISG